jgi:hypothetical protein
MENSWNWWRKRQMLRPASPTSDLGQKQTSRHVRVMSVIPSKRTFISAVCTSVADMVTLGDDGSACATYAPLRVE